MHWGTKESVEVLKAIVMDMNAEQLKMALLMILNGADVPFAIDKANAIFKEVKL